MGSGQESPGEAPPPPLEQAKFQNLLRELFQFECADLDFGIYRIMNHKRSVIDDYIDQALPDAIEKAVGEGALHTEAERARIFEETRITVADAFGEDAVAPNGELLEYQETPLGKKYMLWRRRARLSESAGDVRRDIYNHLYSFFGRYFQDGDFVPKRRYSWEHPYIVPYNGEEVHFHWANRDQYYVKAAEHFKDYSYRTGAGTSVRFFLRSAHTEQNDVKGEKRFFFPLAGDAVWHKERRTLDLPFDYRPLTSAEAKDFGRNRKQDVILERAEAAVADALASVPDAVKALLDRRGSSADDEEAPTLFAHHARRFTRRRTSDFFIHRNLEDFLTRELDYYLKSEVLPLGSLAAGGEMRADAWLDKMRVIREVGRNVIEFVAQIEGFQKMLWEKRKFVVDVQYCVAAGLLPDALRSRVLGCEAQWEEWRALGCIRDAESIFADTDDAAAARCGFLSRNPGILLDTRHFDSVFVDEMLASLDDIDEMTDGVAIKSENWQALNLLQERYRGAITCTYIDPPYNTSASEILYKNGYRHSSWLALMVNRFLIASPLLGSRAAWVVAIDDTEMVYLSQLLDSTFLERYDRNVVVVNHHPAGSGLEGTNISSTHEYAIFMTPTGVKCLRGAEKAPRITEMGFMRTGTASSNLRIGRPNSFYALLIDPETLKIVGVESPPPAGKEYPTQETKEGYIRFYPISNDGTERVWRRSFKKIHSCISKGEVICRNGKTIRLRTDQTGKRRPVFSNWTDKKYNAGVYGSTLLRSMFGKGDMFSYPKSIHTVRDCVAACTHNPVDSAVLDYFAGSGTTGHAVINLNREDGGRRKFILVEMGEHFGTVLLPRLKKVAFSPEWEGGSAKRRATGEEAKRGPRIIKYFRLESYEEALDNIEFEQEDQSLFGLEDYMLRYMLRWETKRSATLLNVAALERPFDYMLRLNGNGDGEDVTVDLPETFNYLLGLAVGTRRVYDDEGRRYLVYAGRTRDGRNAVIIWRNTEGWTLDDRERDRDFVAARDMTSGADEIWMNGDSMVEDARPLDTLFKQRMFASAGG